MGARSNMPGLVGDYNSNGIVDTQDYDLWMTTFNSTVWLFADGNENGIVDAADFVIWLDNYAPSVFVNPLRLTKPTDLTLSMTARRNDQYHQTIDRIFGIVENAERPEGPQTAMATFRRHASPFLTF